MKTPKSKRPCFQPRHTVAALLAPVLLPWLAIPSAMAQSCMGPLNTSCWFNSNTGAGVQFKPDGTKLSLAFTNLVYCGTTKSDFVFDLTSTGLTQNTTLTKNQTVSATIREWTAAGGLAGGGGVSYYVSPTGTLTTGSGWNALTYLDGAIVPGSTTTNVMYTTDVSNGNIARLYKFVEGAGVPTLTQLGADFTPSYVAKIAAASDRVFYTFGVPSDASNSQSIRCRMLDGTACTGWTDITVASGTVIDLARRPTDGLFFARLCYYNFNSYVTRPVTNMIVFDSAGNVKTGFNFSDFAVLDGNADGDPRVRFDDNGNIYANIYRSSGVNSSGTCPGVIKFDPKGNVDTTFQRNLADSFQYLPATLAFSFDVRPGTGEIAISSISGDSKTWAVDPAHVRNPADTRAGAVYNTAGLYSYIMFLHNDGSLIRPAEPSGTTTAKCGVKTPSTTGTNNVGSGTLAGAIQCDKSVILGSVTPGTASEVMFQVVANVTTVGSGKFTISGSGFSAKSVPYTVGTTTIGEQTFYVPVLYSGAALGAVTIAIEGLGSCTADLSAITPTSTTKTTNVLPIGSLCVPVTPTTLTK